MDRIAMDLKHLEQRRERIPRAIPADATLHWRIYYADGRTIGSHQSTWEDAPRRNIVAIVVALNDEPAQAELGTPYYWHFGDWIARVWDATLYLRKIGAVKFGRWASHGDFERAWKEALRMVKRPDSSLDLTTSQDSLAAGAIHVAHPVGDKESGTGWAVFYDNGDLITNTMKKWEDIPSDGVLCAVYAVVYSGIKHMYAVRRYTYYYWREHELVNTDDLDSVLERFPQVKWGQPSFAGKSYLHQAQAIAQALTDNLEDVRELSRRD